MIIRVPCPFDRPSPPRTGTRLLFTRMCVCVCGWVGVCLVAQDSAGMAIRHGGQIHAVAAVVEGRNTRTLSRYRLYPYFACSLPGPRVSISSPTTFSSVMHGSFLPTVVLGPSSQLIGNCNCWAPLSRQAVVYVHGENTLPASAHHNAWSFNSIPCFHLHVGVRFGFALVCTLICTRAVVHTAPWWHLIHILRQRI